VLRELKDPNSIILQIGIFNNSEMSPSYTVAALFALVISFVEAQIEVVRVICPYKSLVPEMEPCYMSMPYCQVYEYTTDETNDGRYVYKCKQCETGFIPTDPIANLVRTPGKHIPDLAASKITDKYLNLCKLDPNNQKPIPCTHIFCRSMFPLCATFTAKNVGYNTATKKQTATFKCEQCLLVYQPNTLESQITGDFDENKVYKACVRAEETRECGFNCRFEFPGCSKYQVSRVRVTKNKDNSLSETASFQCLEGAPGYQPINEKVTMSSDVIYQRNLALREYISNILTCSNDAICSSVMPNCNKYYTMAVDNIYTIYNCTECRSGFEPKKIKVQNVDQLVLYNVKQTMETCMPIARSKFATDAAWKLEVPGCDVLTVSDVTEKAGRYYARYSCDQCSNGFVRVEDNELVPVQNGWFTTDRVKVRCRPVEVKMEAACDENCRKKFPYCRKYTAVFEQGSEFKFETFRCTECDEGFEPTTTPDRELFYIGIEKVVCKRRPTPGEVDCPEVCKANFPFCDRLSIAHDQDGHNIYQCHKCQDGYYRIPYETIPGRLSAKDHFMRKFNQIYLCSDSPNDVYINKEICDYTDPRASDAELCEGTVNCRVVVQVKRLDIPWEEAKCLKCIDGYRPKMKLPHPYDIDQSLCEKIPNPNALLIE